MKTKGLRQRISESESISNVDFLMTEGKKFDMASDSTRRAWKSTANKRRAKLSGTSPPISSVEVDVETELPSAAKKRKVKRKS